MDRDFVSSFKAQNSPALQMLPRPHSDQFRPVMSKGKHKITQGDKKSTHQVNYGKTKPLVSKKSYWLRTVDMHNFEIFIINHHCSREETSTH